jgi:amidase
MSFRGADFPSDVYHHLQAVAATLSPDDVSLSAMRLRASVMSHGDWIKTDRIRGGFAHQWRQFFGEWDVLFAPGYANCRVSTRP